MTTHILTVSETTFKTHLKYMFIGTGKNNAPHQDGALADILSIRENDNIIFYVEKVGFFGIFKAVGNVFYDFNSYKNNKPQYLNSELEYKNLDGELESKTLTYRMKIKALEVYQNPMSEWDMMENPNNILNHSIYNLQWSWIFKKLKANRGCTAIDKLEFEQFKINLIKNNTKLSNVTNYKYLNRSINLLKDNTTYDKSCMTQIPRPAKRINEIKKEVDLRILFTAQAGNNKILDQVLKPKENGNITSILNEVRCSFSDRSMDLKFETDKNKCLLIELKNVCEFNNNIYNQIKEYSRWISNYKINYTNIIPILIIPEARMQPKNKSGGKKFKYLTNKDKDNDNVSPWYQKLMDEINNAKKELKKENINKLDDLQVFLFTTDNNKSLLSFKQI